MGKSTISDARLTFQIPGLSNGDSVLAGTITLRVSKAVTTNFRVDNGTPGDESGMLAVTYI